MSQPKQVVGQSAASALILSHQGHTPKIENDVFVAPNATLIGDVHIAAGASIWFSAVLRGDEAAIHIGERSNLQDGVIVHSDQGNTVHIGDDVTIGHGAIIHGCTIGSAALVGMGAVVLDGAVVERGALVAAGAVVGSGKCVSANTLWAGVPAKQIRDLGDESAETLLQSAKHYLRQAEVYRDEVLSGSPNK